MERVTMPDDVNQDVVFYSRTLATSCPGLSPSQVVIEEDDMPPRMNRTDYWVSMGLTVALIAVYVCILMGWV
jgi:hypothetical protein